MDLIANIREFARQARLERDRSADANECDAFSGFTARLRFRVSKRLEITACQQSIDFGLYDVILSAQNKDQPIRESEWLILRARGLETEEEAHRVGEKLKVAVALSSARARLGVDLGGDKPTSGFGKVVVDAIRGEFQVDLRANVHGLDVYSQTLPVLIPNIDIDASVLTKPGPFLDGARRFFDEDWPVTPRLQDAVSLLNAALINPEPLAQIVLSISAVEMMGQDEEWSLAQKQLLTHLAAEARRTAITTVAEGDEVADAVRRGMHRVGLRQGVVRVLNRIGVPELKREWDDVYGRRSALVHGLDSADRHEISELAQRATTLCARIIFKSLAIVKQSPADPWLNEFYPLLTV